MVRSLFLKAGGLFSGGCILALVLAGSHAESRVLFIPKRFPYTVDPKTPVADLLPTPPDLPAPPLPWLVDDLSRVPEILLQKVVVPKTEELPADLGKLSADEQHKLVRRVMDAQEKAMERTAHGIAKINHLNKEGVDHFLKVLLKGRPDLAGLPFVMGDDCRTDKAKSKLFIEAVAHVRAASLVNMTAEGTPPPAKEFWAAYEKHATNAKEAKVSEADMAPRRIAALMQMLAPEATEHRIGLVSHLSGIEHAEATKALTRLAVFSLEAEVRDAALAALKSRKADMHILLEGLHYPWPAIARNAGEAIAKLKRHDLVDDLVSVLAQPDPRAPTTRKCTPPTVREVVRLNHHHNCLLCHAPGNTPDVKLTPFGQSSEIVTGAVPSPGQKMRPSFQGYDSEASPDILVRVDVNYLRQDFSLMQPVKDAAPWPEMQRFDFLVRTRQVSHAEVDAYRAWRDKQGPDYLPPNHAAAIHALEALTGRADVARTAEAWRKALRE